MQIGHDARNGRSRSAEYAQYAEAAKQKRVSDEKARILRNLQHSGFERQKARIEYEKTMRKQLAQEIKSWRLAEDIRTFVDASSAKVDPDASISERHSRWVSWALTYADSIDPLLGGIPIVEEEPNHHGAWRGRY